MRTPLHILSGTLKMFSRTNMTPEQCKLCEVAEKCVEDMMQVSAQILMREIATGTTDIARQPFNIRHIVNSVTFVLKMYALQCQITLNTSIDDTVPDVINGDSIAIRRILTNLISNAIKVRFHSFVSHNPSPPQMNTRLTFGTVLTCAVYSSRW
jgi:signal transduction histidine kinase